MRANVNLELNDGIINELVMNAISSYERDPPAPFTPLKIGYIFTI